MKKSKNQKIRQDIKGKFDKFEAKLATEILSRVENNETTSYQELINLANKIFEEKEADKT